MEEKKRKELEAKRFQIGSAAEFLELTPEEEAFIEICLELSSLIKSRRTKIGWTQNSLLQLLDPANPELRKCKPEIPESQWI